MILSASSLHYYCHCHWILFIIISQKNVTAKNKILRLFEGTIIHAPTRGWLKEMSGKTSFNGKNLFFMKCNFFPFLFCLKPASRQNEKVSWRIWFSFRLIWCSIFIMLKWWFDMLSVHGEKWFIVENWDIFIPRSAFVELSGRYLTSCLIFAPQTTKTSSIQVFKWNKLCPWGM